MILLKVTKFISILLDKYLDMLELKKIKRVIITLPRGFLFNNLFTRIRKRLIESRCLKCIVDIPAGIYQDTGIPSVILILENNQDEVLLVDASRSTVKIGGELRWYSSFQKKILDVESIKSIISSDDINKKIIVKNDTIIEENYQLVPGIYTQERLDGIALGELEKVKLLHLKFNHVKNLFK